MERKRAALFADSCSGRSYDMAWHPRYCHDDSAVYLVVFCGDSFEIRPMGIAARYRFVRKGYFLLPPHRLIG